ncbi:MlaE family lipid ABC transporter permease subunit [Kordiimonas marina]|uniref:MlaE family lipid ABC transporter permease subunit n=1 Tax=Kordiimonas marina TaxID=2872312 RepID=UPI001FF4A593|nr:MlaE family lipid ABC transporter permease subunit [Kordiimonas marina]
MPEILFESAHIAVERGAPAAMVRLVGDWTIDHAVAIDCDMAATVAACEEGAVLDCSEIGALDTTGAVLIRRYAEEIEKAGHAVLTGVQGAHKTLLEVISSAPPEVSTEPEHMTWYLVPLMQAGAATMDSISSLGRLLSFLGLVLIRLIGSLLNPGRLRLIPILHQMDVVGLRAMGIVGLISFLIGAVMVNQGAIQLAKFGADIFVIDMLGIAHLRELGILLTAIIIAGRSGSAFTAQIGSMKLHEEVDAMMTLGMNPIDVLVLPRLIALVICLPLLTFYADLIGIIGGALMAWVQLDITPANFFVYFRDVISIDHYWVGIIKAPFFAAVIATCGCYQGLQVEGSADALGSRTTKSVVQAIFLVIALDALFSVFFTAIDL